MMNPFYEQFKHMATMGSGAAFPNDDTNIGDVYKSILYQRGFGFTHEVDFNRVHGLGFADSLMSIARFVMPVLKSGLQYLGKQAVSTVADIAQDAIAGENVKEATKRRVTDTAGEIFARVPEAIASTVLKTVGRKRKTISHMSAGKLVTSGKLRAKRARFGSGALAIYPALEKLI